MITVLLGLGGALVYGFADFLGGLAARRARPVVVTAIAAAVGILPLLLGLAVVGGRFSAGAVSWGAVGGVSGGIGVLLLYSALAVGPMSVLSPLTAVFAAVLPAVVAVLRGTVLSPLAVGALVVAVLAVVLVAAVRDASGARVTPRGLLTAVVAGCGLGGIVLAYDASPADSGVATLLVARVLQVVLLGTAALVVVVRSRSGGTADPATSADPAGSAAPPGPLPVRVRTRVPLTLALVVLGCGVCDAAANVFIQAGLHSSTDPTTLPVMGVLNALYPIGTIVLAGVLLRERLTPVQVVGIVLAIAASVALALA